MTKPPPPNRVFKHPGPPVRTPGPPDRAKAFKQSGLMEVVEILSLTEAGRTQIAGFRTAHTCQTKLGLILRRTEREFTPPNMRAFLEGLGAKVFFELRVSGCMVRYFIED